MQLKNQLLTASFLALFCNSVFAMPVAKSFSSPVTTSWTKAQKYKAWLGRYNGIVYNGYHPGEDWNYAYLDRDAGKEVHAIADGEVKIVKKGGGIGWYVVVKHKLANKNYVYSTPLST